MRVSDFSDATLAVGYFGLCLRLVKFRTISIDVRYRRVTIRDRDSEARYQIAEKYKKLSQMSHWNGNQNALTRGQNGTKT